MIELTKECPYCKGVVQAKVNNIRFDGQTTLKCEGCQIASIVGGNVWVAMVKDGDGTYSTSVETLYAVARSVHDKKQAGLPSITPEQVKALREAVLAGISANTQAVQIICPPLVTEEMVAAAERLVERAEADMKELMAKEPKQETWRDREPLL